MIRPTDHDYDLPMQHVTGTWSPDIGAAYLRIGTAPIAATRERPAKVHLDYDEDGHIVGIEVLL